MENVYNIIIKKLSKDIGAKQNADIIGKIFEERSENIQSEIRVNEQYNIHVRKIAKISKIIKTKFKNPMEIIQLCEQYANATSDSEYEYEKLMYKYGVLDGMNIILQGIKGTK